MSNRSITEYHLNTCTIRISRRFSSAREFQMGNFQKYWSQNVGQDFIVLDFFIGGRSCGRKRCVREINVSRAWDPVHAGDKALTRETPAKRGRVNRYGKEKIQWQSVINGLRKEHVLRSPFLDKVLQHFFFLMVICNSLNLLLKSLPINIISCIKLYVNCSALTDAYDWQYKYLFVYMQIISYDTLR